MRASKKLDFYHNCSRTTSNEDARCKDIECGFDQAYIFDEDEGEK
jgi:hypothetical protein